MGSNAFAVPTGLTELLVKFTVAVIKEEPKNLTLFASEYFSKLANNSENDNEIAEAGDDLDDIMPDIVPFKASTRRRSVAVERVDPASLPLATAHPKSSDAQKRLDEAIARVENKLFLYKKLDPLQKKEVKAAMFEQRVSSGTTIIRQGDEGDNFYIVDSGIFHVLKVENPTNSKEIDESEQSVVHTYHDSGFFGELALLHGDLRSASVKAVTDGVLWALDRHSFRSIILAHHFKRCTHQEKFLQQVPLLQPLNEDEIRKVADALQSETYSAGETIIREGDPADCMFFIEEGAVVVRCCAAQPDQEIELKRLDPGQYFGEIALLQRTTRAASVYALDAKVTVWRLDLDAYERLLGRCQEIMSRNVDLYREERMRLGLDG